MSLGRQLRYPYSIYYLILKFWGFGFALFPKYPSFTAHTLKILKILTAFRYLSAVV